MSKTIPTADVVERIKVHGKQGREAWKAGDLALAESEFLACWQALPEPRLDYDYAQSVLTGLVTFFRDTGQVDKARHWLGPMRQAYGAGAGADYVNFFGATIDFEAGDLDRAFEVFDDQYKRFKKRPFDGEAPKYLAFYKQRASGR